MHFHKLPLLLAKYIVTAVFNPAGQGIDIGFGENNSSKYNIKRVVGAVYGAVK
jgi:hypothetical protein